MIARGFKSVIWVATVGSAALACYMVSLRVATERNELAKVERQIIAAKRDIRSLQTELGTRGRMTQLEQWNAEVLALAAPSSAQFLKDEFTLARLYREDPTVAERSAEVRLASADTADTAAAKPAEAGKPAAPAVVQAVAERPAAQPPMIHRASFATAEAPARATPKPPAAKPDKPEAQRTASAATAKPEPGRPAAKPAAKPGKPAAQRTAAATVKPEAPAARPAVAKPSARPEAQRTAAAAKPVREAAAAPRAKGKGGGGN
ncbi:MAG TPA: hypothetical protein VFQ67_03835 [Allosphingosinicella sp.]|nr:hypothetical protein [Allosphingosinicella sp.]